MAMALGRRDILGIDLGYHNVKVVQVTTGRGGSRVKKFVMAPTGFKPQMDPATLGSEWARILQNLLEEHDLKPTFSATAIPGRYVFVKQLRVPAISGERLERIIAYEAKQLIPFPLEQLLRDYHVFPSTPAEHEVTLIAIKRDTVDDRVEILEEAGVRPDVIDVGPICLFNAFHNIEAAQDEVVALVDIGASTTDIVIQQGHVLKFPRSAPVGGNSLTNAIANAMSMDFDQAEELKISSGGVSPEAGGGQELEDILSAQLDKGIATEIRRSFDFFIAQPDGLAVNRVLLCGGTSRLKGIAEFLEDRLGVPVEIGNAVEGSGLQLDSSVPEGVGDIAAVALGLGLRESLPDECVALNFIPPRLVQRKERKKQRPYVAVIGVLVAALGVAGWYYLTNYISLMQEANAYIENDLRVGGGGQRDEEWDQVLAAEQQLTTRIETLDSIADHRGAVTRVFREVASVLPAGVSLQRLTISSDAQRLNMNGEADHILTVDETLRRMRRLPYFDPSKIQPGESSQTPTGRVEFSLVARDVEIDPAPESQSLYEATQNIADIVQAQWVETEAGEVGPRAKLTVYLDRQNIGDLTIYENVLKEAIAEIINQGLEPRLLMLQIVDSYDMSVAGNVFWEFGSLGPDGAVQTAGPAVLLHKGAITFEEFLQQETKPAKLAPRTPVQVAGQSPGTQPPQAPAGNAN